MCCHFIEFFFFPQTILLCHLIVKKNKSFLKRNSEKQNTDQKADFVFAVFVVFFGTLFDNFVDTVFPFFKNTHV